MDTYDDTSLANEIAELEGSAPAETDETLVEDTTGGADENEMAADAMAEVDQFDREPGYLAEGAAETGRGLIPFAEVLSRYGVGNTLLKKTGYDKMQKNVAQRGVAASRLSRKYGAQAKTLGKPDLGMQKAYTQALDALPLKQQELADAKINLNKAKASYQQANRSVANVVARPDGSKFVSKDIKELLSKIDSIEKPKGPGVFRQKKGIGGVPTGGTEIPGGGSRILRITDNGKTFIDINGKVVKGIPPLSAKEFSLYKDLEARGAGMGPAKRGVNQSGTALVRKGAEDIQFGANYAGKGKAMKKLSDSAKAVAAARDQAYFTTAAYKGVDKTTNKAMEATSAMSGKAKAASRAARLSKAGGVGLKMAKPLAKLGSSVPVVDMILGAVDEAKEDLYVGSTAAQRQALNQDFFMGANAGQQKIMRGQYEKGPVSFGERIYGKAAPGSTLSKWDMFMNTLGTIGLAGNTAMRGLQAGVKEFNGSDTQALDRIFDSRNWVNPYGQGVQYAGRLKDLDAPVPTEAAVDLSGEGLDKEEGPSTVTSVSSNVPFSSIPMGFDPDSGPMPNINGGSWGMPSGFDPAAKGGGVGSNRSDYKPPAPSTSMRGGRGNVPEAPQAPAAPPPVQGWGAQGSRGAPIDIGKLPGETDVAEAGRLYSDIVKPPALETAMGNALTPQVGSGAMKPIAYTKNDLETAEAIYPPGPYNAYPGVNPEEARQEKIMNQVADMSKNGVEGAAHYRSPVTGMSVIKAPQGTPTEDIRHEIGHAKVYDFGGPTDRSTPEAKFRNEQAAWEASGVGDSERRRKVERLNQLNLAQAKINGGQAPSGNPVEVAAAAEQIAAEKAQLAKELGRDPMAPNEQKLGRYNEETEAGSRSLESDMRRLGEMMQSPDVAVRERAKEIANSPAMRERTRGEGGLGMGDYRVGAYDSKGNFLYGGAGQINQRTLGGSNKNLREVQSLDQQAVNMAGAKPGAGASEVQKQQYAQRVEVLKGVLKNQQPALKLQEAARQQWDITYKNPQTGQMQTISSERLNAASPEERSKFLALAAANGGKPANTQRGIKPISDRQAMINRGIFTYREGNNYTDAALNGRNWKAANDRSKAETGMTLQERNYVFRGENSRDTGHQRQAAGIRARIAGERARAEDSRRFDMAEEGKVARSAYNYETQVREDAKKNQSDPSIARDRALARRQQGIKAVFDKDMALIRDKEADPTSDEYKAALERIELAIPQLMGQSAASDESGGIKTKPKAKKT